MPRAPRVDPPPLWETEYIDDEGCTVIVEVRDETCVIKTRGYVNREKFSKKLWEIMEKIVPTYLNQNGRITPPTSRDILSSPTRFANHVVRLGLNNTGDLTDLRKVYYPEVKRQLTIFANAIEAKKNSS